MTGQAITILNWPVDIYGPPEPIRTNRIVADRIHAGSITASRLDFSQWPESELAELRKSLDMALAGLEARQSIFRRIARTIVATLRG